MDQIASPGQPAGQYEFNESENAIFTALATAMKVVGTVALALGALMTVGFVVLIGTHRVGQAAASLVLGLVAVVMGIWNRDVARPVEQIVKSSGNDITNLMDAMRKLKKIYSLQQTLLLSAIMLAGLSFFIGLTGG